MKHCIMLLTALAISVPAMVRAQTFTVRADKMNLVYIGIDNPLTIVSGKCNCKDLSVTADIGELKKLEGCNYVYHPDKEGKMTLTISQTTGGKTKKIGEQFFRVKIMNSPYATVGGRKGKYYSLASFKVQKGVGVEIDNYEPEVVFRVTRFKVEVRRQGALLLSEDIKGCYFSPQCTAFFQNLKAGDVVEISGIKCLGPNSRERSLSDITFTMI